MHPHVAEVLDLTERVLGDPNRESSVSLGYGSHRSVVMTRATNLVPCLLVGTIPDSVSSARRWPAGATQITGG